MGNSGKNGAAARIWAFYANPQQNTTKKSSFILGFVEFRLDALDNPLQTWYTDDNNFLRINALE